MSPASRWCGALFVAGDRTDDNMCHGDVLVELWEERFGDEDAYEIHAVTYGC